MWTIVHLSDGGWSRSCRITPFWGYRLRVTQPFLGAPRPVVTVIQSSPDVHLDHFADWLAGDPADLELRIVAAFAGEPVPLADEVGDGLVVLGGHMSAYADAGAPWLPEVRALLADAST